MRCDGDVRAGEFSRASLPGFGGAGGPAELRGGGL